MKSNPRPRKYASDAERQAAFRARNVLVEFRAEPKTADKLTEIAAAIDVSRSDLLLSMVKFALTNHDWARFGLTHKTIPLYQGNPIMATKKASPAQIAARKRFAEMARSGELAKTRKKAVTRVKKNPVTKDNLPDYRKKSDEELSYILKDASDAAKAMRGVDARAEAKYLDQVNDASTVLYERMLNFNNRKINPMVKPESSKNAIRYAELFDGNPETLKSWNDHYIVQFKYGNGSWSLSSAFVKRADAESYARSLARKNPTWTVRVVLKDPGK